ncbi:MAG: lactoylglutathione lyase [Gammaproteobacteria bacterium]
MRLLHTMLRVGDLDRSIQFYTEVLDMHVMSKTDYTSGKFTLVFIGYGSEDSDTVLELTHNWEQSSYDLGEAYGHVAIAVDDIYATVEKMKSQGVDVVREPGPMKFGGDVVIAFIKDPDGYMIELIERH